MHQSILTLLRVRADKTAITTTQCTMVFGQHVLIQSIAITFKFLLTLLKACAGISHSVDRRCIVIYWRNKDQQDALFFLILFQ
jgi:hypothetical protein